MALAQRETQFMKDSLSLTTAQAAQVEAIHRTCLRKISELEGEAMPLAQRKQKITEYKAKRDDELSGLLSAQQLQKYKDLLKAQEERMRARMQTN